MSDSGRQTWTGSPNAPPLAPPRVVNIRAFPPGPLPPDVIYIGRRNLYALDRWGVGQADSLWANRHRPTDYANPALCLEAYMRDLRSACETDRAMYEELRALGGSAERPAKELACWCKGPLGFEPCHGDVIVALWSEYFGGVTADAEQ